MDITTFEDFCKHASAFNEGGLGYLLPDGITREIGHFNVFNVEKVFALIREKPVMPYNRRAYYKISLISGKNIAEYADKVINIETDALLFATPPNWENSAPVCDSQPVQRITAQPIWF